MNHGSRAHAVWAASATARNWACSGALTLAARNPDGKENEAAAWGTACHQVAEKCLRSGDNAASFIDTTETTKAHSFVVDDEMTDTAQQYVTYVWERMGRYDTEHGHVATYFVEQQFSLAGLNPPFDAGGTGDCVIYFPAWKELEVVDLKGGRGVIVEVKGNPQLRTYALGAMLANPGLDVERVTVTIVQPRAPHKDGRIRSETFHVADLVEWTADLLAAMNRSYDAGVANVALNVSPAEWNAKYLVAGDHCKFCPASGFCPALEQRAMDAAGVWFDDLDQPRLSNAPDSMEPAEIAKKLDMLDMIGEWMNALRAYAHAQAELGVEIPGYQLSEKIGNRAWKGDEATVRSALMKLGLRPFELENAKLKSPAQIEKTLGAKRKGEIEPLVERPVRGTNLVATTKTSRPAATPSVNKHFQPLGE